MSTVPASSSDENIPDESASREELLAIAKTLVSQLESDQLDDANRTIYELCQLRENDLFQEIGKLTREMHESLNSFSSDEGLETLMQESLPDAKKRLDYVVQLTEESTHKTLSAIEQCMPLASDIKQGAVTLQNGDAKKNTIDKYLAQTITQSEELNNYMTDILMAQTFQDVTGQVIQRVITLVKDVEDSLVSMIRTCGTADVESGTNKKRWSEETGNNRGFGPSVPGVIQRDGKSTENETMESQDEVDDLLSTLGF